MNTNYHYHYHSISLSLLSLNIILLSYFLSHSQKLFSHSTPHSPLPSTPTQHALPTISFTTRRANVTLISPYKPSFYLLYLQRSSSYVPRQLYTQVAIARQLQLYSAGVYVLPCRVCVRIPSTTQKCVCVCVSSTHTHT